MLPGIPLSPLIPAPHAHPQFPLCCAVVSHFSHAQLFETLWTVTLQAPLSMGFSRQGYWSGLPCPPPGDLADPGTEPWSLMSPLWQAGSLPPGSPMQGFVCVVLSRVQLFTTPPTRLLYPLDSPGKITGVGCHGLLQGSSQPRDRPQVSHIAGRFFTF